MQNFQALRAPPPDPLASSGWGLYPQTPKTAPAIANFWLRASTLRTIYNHLGFRSFCFEQFFLHRLVANLMMLTVIDVCLMLNIVYYLKSFICITHCVTFIPSCYIALSYLFAKA